MVQLIQAQDWLKNVQMDDNIMPILKLVLAIYDEFYEHNDKIFYDEVNDVSSKKQSPVKI